MRRFPINYPSALTSGPDDGRFNHRPAGHRLQDGQAPLTHAAGEDFCPLPGRRVEMHEDSATAGRREMIEELGCKAETKRLLYVIEDFFSLSGRRHHEVSLVYGFRLSHPAVLKRSRNRPITDGDVSIESRWFSLDDLADVNPQPTFLKRALVDPPAHPKPLIVRE